jgi:uncharacterized C2H2 Zn-finger protein
MVLYTCNLCNKEFTLKGDYTRHIHKKFPCSKDTKESPIIVSPGIRQNPPNQIILHEANITSNLICKYCDKMFKRSDYLKNHIELNRYDCTQALRPGFPI